MEITMRQAETDEGRLSELIRCHRAELQTYALRLVNGDAGRAEDVVQETFVRAWRQIDRMTPEYGSVYGWLRRVTYNIAMDGHRMRRVRPGEVELVATDIARIEEKDHADATLMALTVDQVLESMWPEHRAVLVEMYVNDRTAVQAAATLGIPVGTVKSRLHAALRTLRGTVDRATFWAT
jgi:RNA polymerase sigma-70 factor (ECF subfamily)